MSIINAIPKETNRESAGTELHYKFKHLLPFKHMVAVNAFVELVNRY